MFYKYKKKKKLYTIQNESNGQCGLLENLLHMNGGIKWMVREWIFLFSFVCVVIITLIVQYNKYIYWCNSYAVNDIIVWYLLPILFYKIKSMFWKCAIQQYCIYLKRKKQIKRSIFLKKEIWRYKLQWTFNSKAVNSVSV